MATTVRSYSKVNLGLAVGPPRPDGFHELATLYQTLELHDLVTVSARLAGWTEITLGADHPGVPRSETGDAERNTAFRMVEKTLQRLGLDAEVKLHIQKKLPVQGGMGAGSANAAAALLGLEKELHVQLSHNERLAAAAEVGSDVPLFLVGGAVRGRGRGEQVEAYPDFGEVSCVVAVPQVGVSTAVAFRMLDERYTAVADSRNLTPPAEPDRLEKLSRVYAGACSASAVGREPSGIIRTAAPANGLETLSRGGSDSTAGDLAEETLLALVRTGIENDFEEVAFSMHPFLRDIKRQLMGSDSGQPALYAALSGSGSALFGLYRTEADAAAAQQRVQGSGTQAILTKTLPRPPYWARMFAE